MPTTTQYPNYDGLSRAEKERLAAALYQKYRNKNTAVANSTRENEIKTEERPLNLLEWTILHRRRVDPNITFNLTKHQYLEGIYACQDRHIVVMKAGQVGVSEWAVSKAFHASDVRQANVFYVMPSTPDVYDFSQMRFGPALEASPYLESIVVGSSTKGKRGADRTTMRRIRNNFIVFRGGRVDAEGRAKQLKSVPADLVIRDELDEMDQRVIEITRKRLGHSEIKEELDISTPTFEGFGVDDVWKQSDQREWFVPCPHCGRWQFLTIGHFVPEFDDLERPIHWHGMDDDTAWAACEKCGKPLDRLANGRWIATYPGRSITGFHPSKLHTYHNDPLDIVLSLFTTDQERRKEIYNQDLGLPFTPAGGRLTKEIIDQLKRDYPFGTKLDTAPYAGVDVGKVYHIIIRAPMDGNGRKDLLFAGEATNTEMLINILKEYRVKTAVIDALPETREMRKVQAAFPNETVWLAYYTLSDTGTKYQEPWQFNHKDLVVNVDRTRALSHMFAGFYDGETNTLPAAIDGIKDYYKHMSSMVRVRRQHGRSGNEITSYVASGADHYAHAENYCLIASKMVRKVAKAKTA